jgi:hypothetical protein
MPQLAQDLHHILTGSDQSPGEEVAQTVQTERLHLGSL